MSTPCTGIQKLLLEEDAERTAEENSHVVPEEPESEKSDVPEQYAQLWLDMKAYNKAIFREGQKGLSDPSAYEGSCFRLSDYGLDSEVFGVLSIPKLNLQMPIYMGATKENMAAGAAVMGQTSLPIGGSDTNCVLAGHRGWNGAAYFLYINQLEPGDTVTVTNLWETLNYKVSEVRVATVYKGNIIKNLIMDCQSYTKYRPNETTGGIFVSWRRKEELPTGA